MSEKEGCFPHLGVLYAASCICTCLPPSLPHQTSLILVSGTSTSLKIGATEETPHPGRPLDRLYLFDFVDIVSKYTIQSVQQER